MKKIKQILSLSVFLVTIWPVLSFAHTVSVPKTGQTTIYAPGDDGDIQAGVEWPAPRFVNNGDGTVTDNLTGLVWLIDANCGGGAMYWYNALAYCNGLASGSCGLTDSSVAGDWRLPNILELESLVHYGETYPSIPDTAGTGQWSEGDPFSGVVQSIYWSSTTYYPSSSIYDWVWAVDFGIGNIGGVYPGTTHFVWPVRSGPLGPAPIPKTGQTVSFAGGDDGDLQKGLPWANPRFTDNGDGTITDYLTGLVWLKDADCISAHYPGFDNFGVAGDGKVDFQLALDFVTGVNNGTYPNCGGGHTDWRLPNIRELKSLRHADLYSCPSIPDTAGTGQWSEGDPFSNIQCLHYWSNTSGGDDTSGPDYAWNVDVWGLETVIHPIPEIDDGSPVWLVRGDSTVENSPPNIPANPTPSDSEPGIDLISPVLTWSGGDPDPGDWVTYDVYFGRNDPPKLKSSDLADPTFTFGRLSCYTTYYWQVVARDNHGAETSGPLWSFTTTDVGCPVIEGLDPSPCNARQVVTITGRNFGDTKRVVKVGKLRYKRKRIKLWTDTRIDFRMMPYKNWLPGTTKIKNVMIKIGPVGDRIKSNKMPLTITKP
jgi:hypothetical protein